LAHGRPAKLGLAGNAPRSGSPTMTEFSSSV